MRILGQKGIDKIRGIADTGPTKVCGRLMDSLTASVIIQVYDAVDDKAKDYMRRSDIMRVVSACWKVARKEMLDSK